ncbi:glycosyltransferase [Lyngbya confervoides]|uniref:Glycosyltransferase n=1 Tax=Lyngbya confervoides BDU141951 TaxID=1574623 RepID=A0ABD4T994_9CYAN|nr:glycosyltransferase [Lyngbya confervoides]MCM1985147.1 glycosyltransferase [Lyngbya confervoides BDU141951]
MKKLVFITDTYPPDLCGVADYVELVAMALSTTYEVHVITRCIDIPRKTVTNGVVVYEVLHGKAYIFKAIHLIKSIQPDIIDVQLSYSSASQLHKRNLFTIVNPIIFHLSTRSIKRCLTVHELTTYLNDKPSLLRATYRKVRDRAQTQGYHYYFCTDTTYLSFFKNKKNKSFLQSFSNIRSTRSHNLINSKNLVFFGTIAPNKNLDALCNIFNELHYLDPNVHLYVVGGIVAGFKEKFSNLTKCLPPGGWTYTDYLDNNALAILLDKCSYAIFPFSITNKNASVLAMLVNRLVVIAECESLPVYADYGNNFYPVHNIDSNKVYSIIKATQNTETYFPDNGELLKDHVSKRCNVYQHLLSIKNQL